MSSGGKGRHGSGGPIEFLHHFLEEPQAPTARQAETEHRDAKRAVTIILVGVPVQFRSQLGWVSQSAEASEEGAFTGEAPRNAREPECAGESPERGQAAD